MSLDRGLLVWPGPLTRARRCHFTVILGCDARVLAGRSLLVVTQVEQREVSRDLVERKCISPPILREVLLRGDGGSQLESIRMRSITSNFGIRRDRRLRVRGLRCANRTCANNLAHHEDGS